MKAFNTCLAVLLLIVYETAASPLPRLHGLMRQKRCGSGFMYSPSVDMCLPARAPQVPQLVSDSLIAENPSWEIESFANSPQSEDDCPPGTMFSPSLGVCSQIDFGRRESFRPIPAFNLVKAFPGPSSNLVKEPAKMKNMSFSSGDTAADCEKQGRFYIAELDICA